MALKKIPVGMSYADIRHRHPPSPSNTPRQQPTHDVEPNEPNTAPDTPEDNPAITLGSDKPASVKALVKASQRHAPVEALQPEQSTTLEHKVKGAAPGQSIRFRGYVRAPVAGEHDAYDELVEIYGEKKALGLCLSVGMTAYEAALRSPEALGPMPQSKRRGERVETSRSMPADLYAKAIKHLDPKDMLGKSQIGSRILNVAFEFYLRSL